MAIQSIGMYAYLWACVHVWLDRARLLIGCNFCTHGSSAPPRSSPKTPCIFLTAALYAAGIITWLWMLARHSGRRTHTCIQLCDGVCVFWSHARCCEMRDGIIQISWEKIGNHKFEWIERKRSRAEMEIYAICRRQHLDQMPAFADVCVEFWSLRKLMWMQTGRNFVAVYFLICRVNLVKISQDCIFCVYNKKMLKPEICAVLIWFLPCLKAKQVRYFFYTCTVNNSHFHFLWVTLRREMHLCAAYKCKCCNAAWNLVNGIHKHTHIALSASASSWIKPSEPPQLKYNKWWHLCWSSGESREPCV